MMVVWGALTMVTAGTHSPQAIMAIRFFQGIAEATTFVGTHYVLGSWYTERELGKRSGIFTASGLAGTMIGGFMQTGIHTALDGRHGLSGWRWLFLVDGLVTLPVALYGFLLFPDTPATTTARYLSADERRLAVARLQDGSRDAEPERQQKVFSWRFVRTVLTSWEWWGFVVLWVIASETESFSSNALLSLYLKSAPPPNKYTVAQLNNYPTGVPAVGIVSTLFWAALTDVLGGHRDLVGYFIGATGIATSAMILSAAGSDDPGGPRATSVVFAAYYWAGTVYACQAVFFAWANDALRTREPILRGVVLAGMNLGGNAVNAWWSILFYGASMAPWFRVRALDPSELWRSLTNTTAAGDVRHDRDLDCARHLDGRALVRGRQGAQERPGGGRSKVPGRQHRIEQGRGRRVRVPRRITWDGIYTIGARIIAVAGARPNF